MTAGWDMHRRLKMYMVWDVSEIKIYQILMSIFNGTDCLHVYTIEEFYVLMKSKKIIAN